MRKGERDSFFQGPVSRPQDRAELSGSSPPSLPGLARNLDSRGGVSKGKGTRADAGVDILIQGQVVSLLQVQEEEPVRGLVWVKAFMLQPCLLDLKGAYGGAGGNGRTQQGASKSL